MCRSHTEEPGAGADRAAEETSGAGEILPGLLCCPEGVFTEASGTQATPSHAGMKDAKAHAIHTHQSNNFYPSYQFTFVFRFPRRWLTQTSQPRRNWRSTRTKSKPRRGRSSSFGPDIKPRSTGAMRSRTWPWCSEPCRWLHLFIKDTRREWKLSSWPRKMMSDLAGRY